MLRACIAALIVVLAASGSEAAPDALKRCGAKKLAAIGSVCAQTATAWSRWAANQDVEKRDRGVAQAMQGLRDRWARAERRDDGACAERAAPIDDAAARLARGLSELADVVAGGTASQEWSRAERRCVAKVLRLAGSACGGALGAERAYLLETDADARSTGLRRVGSRFATRARRLLPSCPNPTVDVETALATLRADAAGDATVATLRELALLTGRPLGSAAEAEHLDPDPAYGPTLVREFDSLTPQSELKWGEIHTQPDQWTFEPADRLVALAEANGMRVRGHTLVWGGAADPPNPAWVSAVTDPTNLRAVITDHITTLMQRYAGRIPLWDVVNEPLAFEGIAGTTDGLADNHFLRVLGPGYIAEALTAAHAADPTARLFINENFVFEPGPKQDRLVRLVQELKAAGVPLDGIGLQGHVNFLPGWETPTRATIEETLRRIAGLGVDVEITELNVHTWGMAGDVPARLETQRRFYRDVVAACVAVDGCRATTLWLFTDRYPTSIEQVLGQDGMPLVFDDDYGRKPAYFGVRAGLLAAR